MSRVELTRLYWEGKGNLLVRCWMYLKMANNAVNEFRTYGYILTGLYVGTPYLHDRWLLTISILLGIVVVSVPMMVLFGRWLLYRANPAMEYANKVKGSPYQYRVEDATIETAEHLKEIKDLIHENFTNRDKS